MFGPPKTKTSKASKKLNSSRKPVAISSTNSALNHFIATSTPFVDQNSAGASVSTSVTSLTLFQGLADTFTANPQITKPITWGAGNIRYQAGVIVHGVLLKYKVVGAQSNTLLAGDLYNSVRVIVNKFGSSYADTPNPIGGGLDNWFDTGDVKTILHDETHALPSQAFDSVNTYNVPQVIQRQCYLPVNQRYDWFSTNNPPTLWDTKYGDIFLHFISDSGVSPHPSITWCARVYYDLIQ